MDDKQYFSIIDKGISRFNAGKGFRVDYDSHSDWLVFDTRKIYWSGDGIRYFISIYPHFNEHEKIVSWSLYSSASYDKRERRYLSSKEFASKVSSDHIANNIDALLLEAYNYINPLRKIDIPMVPE